MVGLVYFTHYYIFFLPLSSFILVVGACGVLGEGMSFLICGVFLRRACLGLYPMADMSSNVGPVVEELMNESLGVE